MTEKSVDKQEAEELEKQFKFEEAGLCFLALAEGMKEKERQAYYFMRAACCFEMEEAWRRSYFSWELCAEKLNLAFKDGPDTSIDTEVVERDAIPHRTRFRPYHITEGRWDNPDGDTYMEFLGREANDDEKIKHRRAWAYDFAGHVATRNEQHGFAARRYRQAAKAWLACVTFPENKLIAVKFFVFAACETILALGSSASEVEVDTIERTMVDIEELAINDASFPGVVRKNRRPGAIAKQVAGYFTAIRKHARIGGLRNIEEPAIQHEHHFLRAHYRQTRQFPQLFWDWFMWRLTGNGTSWPRLVSVIAITAIIVFPCIYFSLSTVEGNGFDPESMSTGIDVLPRFLNCVYFSIVTLATLGYGDLTPCGAMRAFAAVEAIFGYVFLGLAVFLLTRKMD